MRDQLKTISFAAMICVICSLLLSFIYSTLKDEQEMNKANALKTKVLVAFGEKITDSKGHLIKTQKEIDTIFSTRIKDLVLNSDGIPTEIKVEDLTPEEINERSSDAQHLKKYYPLYIYTNPENNKKSYAIHVSGMGLWSVIKGYIALKDDFETISAVAFYEQQETPGLGGEVDKDFFQNRFQDKKLAIKGKPQHFKVIKAGMQDDQFSVDGISGATMTGNGLTAFINSDFIVYNKYFNSLRK